MARKEQKAPNYTAGGLELYGMATFSLRQAGRMFVETVDKYATKGQPVPPEILDLMVGQMRRALEMWEDGE